MQTQIADEIFKRLDSLAQTLGTTSQYLYGTLAKKGFALGIVAILTILAFVISLAVMIRSWNNAEVTEDGVGKPGVFATAILASIASIALLIASFDNFNDLVYLISPESYATERVIQILK